MAFKECNYFVLVIIQSFIFILCDGTPISSNDAQEDGQSWGDSSWIMMAIISVSSMITLISVLFICGSAGGCCGRLPKIYWFGRPRQQGPMSFENPAAEINVGDRTGSSIPLSQIDVRALELDPVVFEPLPTILDLTPISNPGNSEGRNNNSNREGHGSASTSSRQNIKTALNSTVVPFATEDSELYAHDWFDEPYKNFQRNHLEFIREVGRGWFGEVLEAEAKDIVPFAERIRVLVKRLRQDASQIDQMRFLDESRMYRDSSNGNILKLLGHSIEKLPFLLIMEHCQQGDLKSYLIANVTRAETLSNQGALFSMALDIAKGLEWMTTEGFKHADLAARNCQVASEGRIVIGDYGLATQLFHDDYYWNSNVPIPLRWAAPETIHCTPNTIQTLKVTKYSNIWSYAIVLWEILEFAKLPYFELTDEDVITRVLADKNYFLGQPTLPYIPYKEELYTIMKSCWSIDPRQRPDMTVVISQLLSLINKLKSEQRTEEFDSKWERLGRISSSSSFGVDEDNSNKGRNSTAKKSVSFTGLQNVTLEIERLPEDEDNVEQGKDTTERENNKISTEQLHEMREDAKWLKEFDEGGGVSQKVMEQSQSVQNFMVLTHVEPSDIHGPESLMEIDKNQTTENYPHSEFSSCQAKDENSTIIHESHDQDSGRETSEFSFLAEGSTQNEVSKEVEIKSTTEETVPSFKITTDDASSPQHKPNIEQDQQQQNQIAVPEISVEPSTPGTTPNLTGIDINVIQPSPVPEIAKDEDVEENNISKTMMQQNASAATKKRIIFNFEDNPTPLSTNSNQTSSKGQRRTSTPKRSGSATSPIPPLPITDNLSPVPDDVFDETDTNVLNDSCNLSPISMKKSRSGVAPGQLFTTIVGANDDLGLEVFQGVTSQLESNYQYNNDSSETEAEEFEDSQKYVQNGHGFSESFSILAGDIKKGEPLSLTPRSAAALPNGSHKIKPRVLFTDQVTTSPSYDVINSDEMESKNPTASPSFDIIDTGITAPSSSWDCISSEDPTFPDPHKFDDDSTDDHPEEIDDFLSRQIQSLSTAAADTKSLFALSLGTEYSNPENVSDKFIQDIQAAQDELGSLVYEDLEDESGVRKEKIIPEDRRNSQEGPSEYVGVKVAFVGPCLSPEQTRAVDSGTSTTVENWDQIKSGDPTVSIVENTDTSGEDNDDEASGQSSSTFMPSKWNQSLIPARPAIKSPNTSIDVTQQHESKSSLKKSVSFERKKRQVVYEYPLPPASDSEEEINASTKLKLNTLPLHSSLDWDLTQEELEFAAVNQDDSDDDVTVKSNPMDMYRISGFEGDGDEPFQVRGSNEPFQFQPSKLGELRHTRDKLKLDLPRREETSILPQETIPKSQITPQQQPLDSGVGSNPVSPFSQLNCDDNPKNQISTNINSNGSPTE